MMSAAALLGALANMTLLGLRSNWRIASMIVTVFPVPGLDISMSDTFVRESKR